MADAKGWMTRRELARLMGAGGAALAAGLPERVFAQAQKTTLVIGIDISDTVTLDPARQAQYSPPMTLQASYDTLITFEPGDYVNHKPALATKWERTPDGKAFVADAGESEALCPGPMTRRRGAFDLGSPGGRGCHVIICRWPGARANPRSADTTDR